MTYALGHALGDLSRVGVGRRAFADPVLAKASLDASSIMLAMAKATPSTRLDVMQAALDRMGVRSDEVVAEMKRSLRPSANPDQVTFDALRMAIANARVERSLDNMQQAVASRGGWDTVVDSGVGQLSPNDRATGCMITGGANIVGGAASLVPGYGTLIGAAIGIGSSIASGALNCGADAQAAAANAALAQQQLQMAQAQAAQIQAQALADSRRRRFQTVAVGGAILLAVLGAAWVVLD